MNVTPDETLLDEAIALAEAWQNRANALLTPEEKTLQKKMARLLTHPRDKVILTRIIDQSFRSGNMGRVADQICYLFKEYSVPEFFEFHEQALARWFQTLGRYIPSFTVPKMIERIREQSSRAIVPGEREAFLAHLERRKKEGVRMNVNFLGEAVLGEEEALKRLGEYVEALHSPEVEYVSVKISTIYSQIHSLAFEHGVNILVERLSQLYRAARDNVYERADGTRLPKFVNLDMEEYRDLDLTVAAFRRTLDREEFKNTSAGIALQAYLPDSYPIQRELTAWARKRVEAGGAPVKIRIVKGANMEMEQVDAFLHHWPLAPYDNKLDVDASYKRMVEFGMVPENIRAVHLGIASHNLFDLAYACTLARHRGVPRYFSFEMLEGMADHVRRAIQETTGDLVYYAPVAAREQFINAIAYLIRRLDENTGEENFLRYLANLKTGSKEWTFLKNQFVASWHHRNKAGIKPHRTQNRLTETFFELMGTLHTGEFHNEPDTDWALAPNRQWAEEIRAKWKKSPNDSPMEIPLVVAGEKIFAERLTRDCLDPSQFADRVCVARFALAQEEDIDRAIAVARADPDGWRSKTHRERHEILSKVAMELRRARGDLIGAAVANTGKIFTEADVEVSEAVDFAEFYPHSARPFTELSHVKARGKGVAVVISPWNFPIAIPCGGITASLAAGNTVVFKPSSDAVLVAWVLCQSFWRAGVSKNVLQFVPCSGGSVGSRLTGHPDVDYVILTGGTETGLKILEGRPGIQLSAETGGKNATIVTAMADRDQAVKDIIYSAFGNCGQKCSATSFLILEHEVYEDENFKQKLVDAAASLDVGSAWNFQNRMGTLIKPPSGDLLKGLTELEPGETWALRPKNVHGNPYMWSPGIKYGVQPGSTTHTTELFGPVLGVMRAENLDHAIELTNQTGYGLTSGLESLDKREQEKWKASIRAGNLYINRGTTGAITLRQPFGGMGKSALGAGIKAGGPDYVAQFMAFEETGPSDTGAIRNDHALLRLAHEWELKLHWGRLAAHRTDLEKTIRAVKSYLYRYEQDFAEGKDYFHLRGQDNVLRYLPVGIILVRLSERDSLFETLARMAAVVITGSQLILSLPDGLDSDVTEFILGRECKPLTSKAQVVRQSDAEIIRMLPRIHRIRYAAPDRVPKEVFVAAARTGFFIARTPVMMEGRIELLWYFQQQSLCDNYHRYGNLGERAMI